MKEEIYKEKYRDLLDGLIFHEPVDAHIVSLKEVGEGRIDISILESDEFNDIEGIPAIEDKKFETTFVNLYYKLQEFNPHLLELIEELRKRNGDEFEDADRLGIIQFTCSVLFGIDSWLHTRVGLLHDKRKIILEVITQKEEGAFVTVKAWSFEEAVKKLVDALIGKCYESFRKTEAQLMRYLDTYESLMSELGLTEDRLSQLTFDENMNLGRLCVYRYFDFQRVSSLNDAGCE